MLFSYAEISFCVEVVVTVGKHCKQIVGITKIPITQMMVDGDVRTNRNGNGGRSACISGSLKFLLGSLIP